MKLVNHIFLIILPCLIKCSSDFSETENEIVVALAKYFRVAFCVFSSNEPSKNPTVSLNESFPSRQNTFTTYLSFTEVENYLKNDTLQMKYGGLSMVILKLNQDTISALRKISQKTSLSPVKWLMFADRQFDPLNFQGVYIPFDCEFIYATSKSTMYLMSELYRVRETSKLEKDNFGYWSLDRGLDAPKTYFYERRKSLKNEQFVATIGTNPPYTYAHKEPNGRIWYEGYSYEVWQELEFRLKFKTVYPEKYMNKTVPEMEELLKKDVDFAVAPIKLDPVSVNQMDLSQTIYEAKIYLFGYRPGSELEWNSYLKPFSSNTWLVNLGWMICSSIALGFLYKVAWTYGTSEAEADYFQFTFTESFATVFRAMCMQGSDITPRSNSCRLLFLSIYLTALVVSSAFSAALFSLLTIPTQRSPFKTFEDVTSSRSFRMGILQDSDILRKLEDVAARFPSSPHYKFLHKTMDRPSRWPKSLEQGLQWVCKSKNYIMLWDKPNVLATLTNETLDCQERIMHSGPPVFKEHIGFGFKKGSPYRHLINLHIVRMRNEGIMKRLLMNFWPPEIPHRMPTWVKVTIEDISPIIYLFCIGAGLSVVFLFLENIKGFFSKGELNKKKEGTGTGIKQTKYFWENIKSFIIPGPVQTKWDVQNENYINWMNNKNNWQANNDNMGIKAAGETVYWDDNYGSDPFKTT